MADSKAMVAMRCSSVDCESSCTAKKSISGAITTAIIGPTLGAPPTSIVHGPHGRPGQKSHPNLFLPFFGMAQRQKDITWCNET